MKYFSFALSLKLFCFPVYCLMEKAMAPYSSTLAWKTPWTEEPSGLQSMGSRRVRHDWATSLSLFTLMHWRGKWQPTPVFLPGESQGRGSLVGCRLWGRTESEDLAAAVYCLNQSMLVTSLFFHILSKMGKLFLFHNVSLAIFQKG